MESAQHKLSGIQKAALLLITLGPEASSAILKKIPEAEIQKITYEIANIPTVSSEQRGKIFSEFIELNKAKEYLVEGGIDYAKILLTKTFGVSKASDILGKVSESSQYNRPFALARKADSLQIVNALAYEHPQTIALVLCYLQSEKAAQVIAELPVHLQTDVAYRIATMNNTSPSIVKEIEKIIESKLSNIVRTEMTTLGGVEALVEILNKVDRNTEKNITEKLEDADKELAERIKSSMFIFEDITKLDDTSIQRVLRDVDNKDLALALKGCAEEILNRIYKNLSKKAAELLKEEIEYMGPVRLVEVEKAQQKIVGVIRQLDESQEIIISRGGTDAIIV